jgi:hypothetical protein
LLRGWHDQAEPGYDEDLDRAQAGGWQSCGEGNE